MNRTRVAIIGSTGSIGRQALEVAREHPDVFDVVALAAGRSAGLLAEQAAEFQPEVVCLTGANAPDTADSDARAKLERGSWEFLRGEPALEAVAALPQADVILVASSGRVAMPATLAAVGAGKDVALANKESLVIAGELVTREAARTGARLFPVDSEHSAIWQCLFGEDATSIRRLLLTASGGPFRATPAAEMASITVEQAMAHPTWQMGPKITVDSATLMNKGLEAIEARWLFDVGLDRIEIVVHPRSIVHSLIEFVDGSLKAQLGWPDMKLPIQLALTKGKRLIRHDPFTRPFDLTRLGALQFEAPDMDRFPCLRLAIDAGQQGGTAPAVLSAADEIAVEWFLRGELAFMDIPRVVRAALDAHTPEPVHSLDQLLEVDRRARETAVLACRRMVKPRS
ncbi:MAG TPA: 1-deoxy-D-xylulose-5-phosphate reductoisomerase [Chloroflexota bacterium]|nr:1-deoxy-D-xylulose-5-phosphate reductoisomerase [Chloroflexota bacterium]